MPALRLSLFYCGFFLCWGCVLPYWPVWYATRGLSPEMIGVAGGVGLMARLLVSPVAAFWSDGVRRAKDPLIILSWLTLAFWIVHVPVREPWMLCGLAFLTGAALYPIIPLTDSLAVREARLGGFAFGPVRAVGSAAFIAANLASGALIGWLGGEAMLGWMIGAALLMGVAALLLPARERAAPAEPAGERLRALGRLLRRRSFLLVMIGGAAVAASHSFYYAFSALAWREQGMPTVWVGALWGLAVAAEVVFLAVSGRFANRINPLVLVAIGGAAGCVRWLALAMSPPLLVVILLQPLHALSFGASFLGFIQFAEAEAGEKHAASVFALGSALSGGGLSAVLTVASGWLYAHFGAAGFAAMAVPAALGGGAVLYVALVRRWSPESATANAAAQPQSDADGAAIEAP